MQKKTRLIYISDVFKCKHYTKDMEQSAKQPRLSVTVSTPTWTVNKNYLVAQKGFDWNHCHLSHKLSVYWQYFSHLNCPMTVKIPAMLVNLLCKNKRSTMLAGLLSFASETFSQEPKSIVHDKPRGAEGVGCYGGIS